MLFMDDLIAGHPKSNDNSGLAALAGSGLGAMMSGGNGKGRRENDFYPTPPEPIWALVQAERKILDFFVWHKIPVLEPACGDGAISKILESIGLDVISTDLIDRGYGVGGMDFLKAISPRKTPIITNPPYGDFPEEFLMKAIELDCPYIAMFLKSNYFNTIGHGKLHDQYPPAREYKLTWRVDFLGLGRPTMTASWFVWDFISPRKSMSPEVFILHQPKLKTTNQQELFT